MSSFPTIRPARDSNDISTTVWQGALRCSECDHEVAIAVDSLPEDMSGQAAPHEQFQEPLAPLRQQPRQEAAHGARGRQLLALHGVQGLQLPDFHLPLVPGLGRRLATYKIKVL